MVNGAEMGQTKIVDHILTYTPTASTLHIDVIIIAIATSA